MFSLCITEQCGPDFRSPDTILTPDILTSYIPWDATPDDGEVVPQSLTLRTSKYTDGTVNPTVVHFIYGEQRGVPLVEALSSSSLPLLRDGDDRGLFEGLGIGSKVCYNILWPGYTHFKRQTSARCMLDRQVAFPTRRIILRQIARVVSEFISERKDYLVQNPKHAKWQVGLGGIQLEHLVVVGVRHVSKSGLQPILAYYQKIVS